MIEMDNEEDSSVALPQTEKDDGTSEHNGHFAEQVENTIDNAHVEPKQMVSLPAEKDENESAEVIQDSASAREEDDQKPLKPELEEGLKILNSFLADTKLTKLFRENVLSQLSDADVERYKKEIRKPMCLSQMKEKFQKGEYDSLTQVVQDFKLMIYNCHRFNGINHPVSKQAEKINFILGQKLNLLRQDIRSKLSQDSFLPWLNKQENKNGSYGTGLRKRTANHRRDDSSAMLNQLRMEEEQKAKEERRLKKEELRAAQLAAQKELLDWEEENLTTEPIKSVIRHSWELPQIGLFLYLCGSQLMLEEVPMYELERCLAMARQSKRLQQIMTALLSTPCQREKRAEKSLPDMPYSVWVEKLAEMVALWYKVLEDCKGDRHKASIRLGLDEQSFEVMGSTNLLQQKLFHNLTFYKKIWILKSVCEYLVEKQECLRNCIENQDPVDQRGLILGSDRYGNQYVHFPQFCGPNLRIYRQRRPMVPSVREEEEEEEREKETRATPLKAGHGAKRKLNLEGLNGRRSRSATPLNDSETDGTASPARSDSRPKSHASSSRHSSPLPRESNGRSRQTSARNSPAPDTSLLDSLSLNSSSTTGRKTRNSAESSFFNNLDLDTLLRRNSRRGRGAKKAAKETPNTESSSNGRDETSQDGLLADMPTSGSDLDGSMKTEAGRVNGKMKGVETDDPSSIERVGEPNMSLKDHIKEGESAIHSDLDSDGSKADVMGQRQIKEEFCGSAYDTDTPHARTDDAKSREICDKPDLQHVKSEMQIPSLKLETRVPAPLSASSITSSSLKAPVKCETSSLSATHRNPSKSPEITPLSTFTPIPTTAVDKLASGDTLMIESTGDDSGIDSFQMSPRSVNVGVKKEDSFTERSLKIDDCKDRSSEKVKVEPDQLRNGDRVSQDSSNGGSSSCSVKVEIKPRVDSGNSDKSHQDSSCRCSCNYSGIEPGDGLGDCDKVPQDSSCTCKNSSSENIKDETSDDADLAKDSVKNEAGQKNEDHSQSPQLASDSNTSQSQGLQAAVHALLDHDSYSEEEMVPDPGEFELIVEDMEGLEKLLKEFDPEQTDASPQINTGARQGKRQKSKPTPKTVKRSSCENDLHKRLLAMWGELQQFKGKLASSTKKAQLKLQKECQSYIEKVPEEDDVKAWESDVESDKNTESEMEGSCSREGDTEDSQDASSDALPNAAKKKIPSKAPSVASMDSTDADQRDIEEYEADVSSRGRLRKRRLIPNNVEDQGVKKKKVVKKTEEETPVTSASQMPSIMLPMSNSEFLAMIEQGGASQFVQQLAAVKNAGQIQDLQVTRGPGHGSVETRVVKPSSVQSKAHPVIQKILSSQTLGNSHQTAGITVQQITASSSQAALPGKVGQPSAVTVSLVSTATTVTISKASGVGPATALGLRTPLVMTSGKGGKQQVFMVTAKQQEELLRSGVLRRQEPTKTIGAGQAVVTTSLTTGGRVIPAALTQTSGGARHLTVLQAPRQAAPSQVHITPPQSLAQVLITATSKPTDAVHSSQPVPGRVVVGTSPSGPSVSPAKVQGVVAAGAAASPRAQILSTPKGVIGVPVSGQMAPSVRVQGMGGTVVKPPMIVNNPSGSRTLVVFGNPAVKTVPRYASNVTVKALLENRAANKAEEGDNTKAAESSPASAGGAFPQGSIIVTSASVPFSCPVTIVTANVSGGAPATSMVQQLIPGSVRLPSSSSLDDALQKVVTGYHTTLPTADIKVPSPTTLPSLSPRKNVTRTVPSTRAPIPTTTKVQTKHTHVVRARTITSGASVLSLGSRAVTGLVPGSTVVRPGTVVMPAGQGRTGIDPSGNKQLVVQVVPQGAGTLQGYVVPQGGAFRTLQIANVKTTQSLSKPVVSNVMVTTSAQILNSPVLSSGMTTGAPNEVSSQGVHDLLMTASSSTVPSSSGSSQAAATTKTTSKMLKSMLAAKAVAMNSSALTCISTVVPQSSAVISSPAVAKAAVVPGSALQQQNIAQLTQMPRIIKAHMAGVGPGVANTLPAAAVGQGNLAVIPQVQQQGVFAGRILATSAVGGQVQSVPAVAVAGLTSAVSSSVTATNTQAQRVPVQNVVHVSLPAGLQLGLHPGASAVRLVAAGQPGSGSVGNTQPVLATIRSGTQGLQQLQLLASAGSLQRAQVTAQPQQHLTVKASTGTEQVVSGQATSEVGATADQQQTVQLCFKVEPGRQGTVSAAAASVMPQPVLQGLGLRAMTPTSEGGFSVLGGSSVSPYSSMPVPKVIMASSAVSAPVPAPLQQNSTCSVISQPSATAPPVIPDAGNHLSTSVTPSPMNRQFTISPISSSPISDASKGILRQLSTGKVEVLPPQMNTLSSGDGTVPQCHTFTVSASPTHVLSSLKRSLQSDDIQPVPAKKACLETTGGGNSGAVLASLSQLVGSMKGNSTPAAGDATVTSLSRETLGSGIQRIVMARGAGGDNSASSTLLNLAAHISPGSSLASASGAVKSSDLAVSAVSSQIVHQANMAQFLQQIAAAAPGGVQVKTLPQTQQQQQVVAVRRVGGQLLTDHNIPVTENNGEYKVLPQATLQLGSQTVTVLSPSSAMIQHNRRSPLHTVSSSPGHCQSSVVMQSEALADGQMPETHIAQGMTSTAMKQEIKLGLPAHSQPQLNSSTPSGQANTEVRTVPVKSGADISKAANIQENFHTKSQNPTLPMLEVSNTGLDRKPISVENGVSNRQQLSEEHLTTSGEVTVQDQPPTTAAGVAQHLGILSGNKNEVEEEAALNLLTLANQPAK